MVRSGDTIRHVPEQRRLRRLVPDRELVYRRAAGEPLRTLAGDYGVAHTTLSRYFRRPSILRQLKQAERAVRAERRGLAKLRARERRLERQVRRRAREELRAARVAARLALAANKPKPASPYEEWLDERGLRRPPLPSERYSANDEIAERVVAAGGGLENVKDATGLRTRENVLRLIAPTIVGRALANDDRRSLDSPPQRMNLRRLVPDGELLRRRAAGEPLRSLAHEYDVAHTTLARYFARPQVRRQLREHRRNLRVGRLEEVDSQAPKREK